MFEMTAMSKVYSYDDLDNTSNNLAPTRLQLSLINLQSITL